MLSHEQTENGTHIHHLSTTNKPIQSIESTGLNRTIGKLGVNENYGNENNYYVTKATYLHLHDICHHVINKGASTYRIVPNNSE